MVVEDRETRQPPGFAATGREDRVVEQIKKGV
jgi:hypothetical protein